MDEKRIPVFEIRDYMALLQWKWKLEARSPDDSLEMLYIEFSPDGWSTFSTKESVHVTGSAYGNGNTADEAIKDYCKRVSGKTLIVKDPGGGSHYVEVPQLKHTLLYKK